MTEPNPIRVIVLTSTNVEHNLTLRLRVGLMQPHLEKQGYSINIFHMSKSRKKRIQQLKEIEKYDLVWIHRHIFGWKELRIVRAINSNIIFDYDDPVGYSSSKFANFGLSRWVRFQLTVATSSAVIAASPGLVKMAKLCSRNIHYIPLCAEPERYSLKTQRRAADEPLRLLWLGGRSTFKYLQHTAPSLEAIGEHCKNVELVVVGHSTLSLNKLKVINMPWSANVEAQQLETCHVGLVPSTDDRWTRAKATLKPLQYMASGLPILAPEVGILTQFCDNGNNGFLVKTNNEWVNAIQRLSNDEALRLTMGENCIRYVKQHHSAEVLAPKVEQAFRSVLYKN
ncbi:MAG: glycosyltransferase family 4 protein [Planctomycetes bacterium]|nr:glycosyltransferase family 4 protein [Planctomycetota bacterium]